jgi:hypothetical protein
MAWQGDGGCSNPDPVTHQCPTPTTVATSYEGDYEWKNPVNQDGTINDFYNYFVNGVGEYGDIETMNCWEMVLKANYDSGVIDADWIKEFYNTANSSDDPNASIWNQLGASDATSNKPAYGNVVFFTQKGYDVPGHVALSLGGNKVVSLWTGPDGKTSVQITTTDAIAKMMGGSVSVTTGVFSPY